MSALELIPPHSDLPAIFAIVGVIILAAIAVKVGLVDD